jgi:hypothetical protein
MKENDKVDIYNSKTIKKFLGELFKDNSIVRIWQNYSESKNYCLGKIVKYKHNEELITFKSEEGYEFNFNKNLEVYFHTNFKETIFKTEIVQISSDSIIVKRPALVKIKDARAERRKNFGINSYHFAELEFPNGDLHKVYCLDTSASGVGIMANRSVFADMFKGLKVEIINSSVAEHIGKYAVIRNLGPIDNVLTNEVNFRIGLEIV